jgi:tRNA1Val (adenine37-N6)-methyltransferase
MKVGMDGVLLGAWADPSGAERILDIGAGTGLIALMMTQKNSHAQIDAIEIDFDAFQEAGMNFQNSVWNERIHSECCSFQEFSKRTIQKYDLVLSNPPFFNHGLKAPLENRAKARHSDTLPLAELISGAKLLMTLNGRLALILPFESLSEIENLAKLNGLYISRLCRVKPNPLKPNFRILIELTLVEHQICEESLMIEFEKHHDYTPEYMELTREFYLKF